MGEKMNKKLLFLVCFCVLFFCISCKKQNTIVEQKSEQFPQVVRGAVLNGPSGIGLIHLFENKPAIDGEASMEICATPDVLLPKLLKGELDIGILPPNVAAKVFNNTGSIVCGGVIGWGMLNLITKDTSVKSIKDLKGKTIYSAGFGSTPEYILRYILEKNNLKIGIEKDDVKLDFSISNAEIPVSIISDKIEYAFLPEPFATVAQMRDKNIIRSFDVQKVYKECSGNDSYPMTMIVIRKDFAEQYPSTVRMYLQSCAQSVGLVNAEPKESSLLVEKHNLGLKATIVEKVIPNAAYDYKSAIDAKKEIEQFYNLFLEFAPEAIGSNLPADDFYFK